MKRVQILIHLESDSTESHRDNVALVKQKHESMEVDCNQVTHLKVHQLLSQRWTRQ